MQTGEVHRKELAVDHLEAMQTATFDAMLSLCRRKRSCRMDEHEVTEAIG